jgi:hypothetical protein
MPFTRMAIPLCSIAADGKRYAGGVEIPIPVAVEIEIETEIVIEIRDRYSDSYRKPIK